MQPLHDGGAGRGDLLVAVAVGLDRQYAEGSGLL